MINVAKPLYKTNSTGCQLTITTLVSKEQITCSTAGLVGGRTTLLPYSYLSGTLAVQPNPRKNVDSLKKFKIGSLVFYRVFSRR